MYEYMYAECHTYVFVLYAIYFGALPLSLAIVRYIADKHDLHVDDIA